MSNDPDGFNRWDAGQRLAIDVIQSLIGHDDETEIEPRLVEAYRGLLNNDSLDQALVAKMLQLPSENYLVELSEQADVPSIHHARERVLLHLANALRDDLLACYQRNNQAGEYELTSDAIARRSLKNIALGWLLHIGDEEALALATEQFQNADNMTDRLGALRALVNSGFDQKRTEALDAFYEQFQHDPQVVEMWFSVQSASHKTGQLPHIRHLLGHEAFDWKNPNKVRSVVGAFAGQNLPAFHNPDGSGYEFLAEVICRLDDSNPQIAARLVTPLSRWKKFAPTYSEQMKKALESIRDKEALSKDVYEVVHKSLAD